MNIYPAIDLYAGEVVRLTRGDYMQRKVYSDDPAKQASQFEELGASWIHVVDLEGAKGGTLVNLEAIRKIRKAVRCPIQCGGGIRNLEDIRTLASEGVNRVILGTKALEETFFSRAIREFEDLIAVSLDVREGRVQTQGWLQESGQSTAVVLDRFRNYPLQTIIYTDIQRDGMLTGPNFEGLGEILAQTRSRVIFSGGITELADIERCLPLVSKGLDGVIIGKALYEKKIDLLEVMALVRTVR